VDHYALCDVVQAVNDDRIPPVWGSPPPTIGTARYWPVGVSGQADPQRGGMLMEFTWPLGERGDWASFVAKEGTPD
jgi:hypothetical protein